MMPWVAAVKSGLAELLESDDGEAWRSSSKAFPLSLTWRQKPDRSMYVCSDRRTDGCEAHRYLCVVSSNLLIQLLVFLDSSFQLCCCRWQRSFRTRLNPGLHFHQELPRQTEGQTVKLAC